MRYQANLAQRTRTCCLLQAGWTPLHWAAHRGRTDTVRVICAAGVEVDAAATDSMTPLALAALGVHSDTACELLRAGADVSAIPSVSAGPPLTVLCQFLSVCCALASSRVYSTFQGVCATPAPCLQLGEGQWARTNAAALAERMRRGEPVQVRGTQDHTSSFAARAAQAAWDQVEGALPEASLCQRCSLGVQNCLNGFLIHPPLQGSGPQLYEAAKAGQVETVRELLAGGVDTTEHTDKVRPLFRQRP